MNNELPPKRSTIQVIRFDNNTEIIADLEYMGPDQGEAGLLVRLHDAMRFSFIQAPSGQRYLQLAQWNPLSLYKQRFIDIDMRKILYTSDPSDALEEYYIDVVSQWDMFHAQNPDAQFAKIKTVRDMMKDMEEFHAGGTDSELADEESLGDTNSAKKLN